MKSCILKNAKDDNLNFLIKHNIETLNKILDYNLKHRLLLFRISSGFILFASHSINEIPWATKYKKELLSVGDKIKKYRIRVSMHPGQYTTLSSPNEEIVKRAIEDLKYQTQVLDSMGLDSSNKVILHIGGRYDDKRETMDRFIVEYEKLPQNIKNRLVIENDDKIYTVEDVLYISKKTGIPLIFDYFHHVLNHAGEDLNWESALMKCRKTWGKKDGVQKVHYSQQAKDKRRGSHSLTISLPEFIEFYNSLPRPIDVMLEVKDKNISAIKCIYAVENKGTH